MPGLPAVTTRLKLQALAVASAFGSLAAGLQGTALANPTGAQVVNGQATFNAAGNTLTITNTPGAVINWQSFSIGASELTKFNQQSTSSAVLNRVVGADPSSILGQLQSNGKVFLINPAGIVFGQGARIDVGGLVASTANISNADFLAGKHKFEAGVIQGNVTNQGTINAAGGGGTGGTVMLIGKDVSNSGIIQAPNGQIVLAAGKTVEVIDTATPGVKVVFTADTNKAENLGTLAAQNVNIAGALLRNKGIISANTVSRDAQGRIVLSATKSVTLESGSTITANGPQGGAVTMTAGNDIKVEGNTLTQANGSAGPGGTITLTSTETGGKITVDAGALIQANGASALTGAALAVPTPGQAGGFIAIQSVKGSTTIAGALEARGIRASATMAPGTAPGAGSSAAGDSTDAASGGTVQVLGAQVALLGEARVDASGTDGGGVILVGGDYQGKNVNIQNALTTVVDRNVVLRADADLTANGGKVIVWADNATHFVGSLSARGGALGGNGGFAEVSGKNYLYFRGRADLSSKHGTGGQLLLDPSDIIIARNPATGGDDSIPAFTANYNPVVALGTVDIDGIEAIINGGTSVTIQTSAGTVGSGDITLSAGEIINKTAGGASSFTLLADRDIIIGNGAGILVNTTANALTVNFTAGRDIKVNTTNAGTATLSTKGGAINFSANNNITIDGPATLNTSGGNILIKADAENNLEGSVVVGTGASILSGNGSINLSGKAAVSSFYGVSISGAGTVINSGTGSITVAGSTTNTAGGAGIYFLSSASIQASGAGNISLTGTGSTSAASSTGLIISAPITHSGSGNIDLTGIGGGTGVGPNSNGITQNSQVLQSGSGAISINATGGGASGTGNRGLYLNGASATIIDTGGGGITVNASATSSGSGAHGIEMISGSINTSSSSGNVSINAVTTSSNAGSAGLYMNDPGSGSVGIGGGNGATININAQANAGAGLSMGNGAGTNGSISPFAGGNNLTINVTAASSSGTDLVINGLGSIGTNGADTARTSGNVTIYANTLDVLPGTSGGTRVASGGSGNLYILPRTAGQTITVGGSSPTSFLNNSELSHLSVDGSGKIYIGRDSAILVNATTANVTSATFGSNATIVAATGNVNVTGANTITGALTLNARANGGSAGVVNVTGGGTSINTSGGDLLLAGGANASGMAIGSTAAAGAINISAALINAAGGSITLRGQGQAVAANNVWGVAINGGASVQTNGAGTISISGAGGGTGAVNGGYGVYLGDTNSLVQTVNGAVTINGTGGNSTVGVNAGVLIDSTTSGGGVQSLGSGAIVINGLGGTGGSNAHGVQLNTAGSVAAAGSGNLDINGTGGAVTGGTAVGVFINGGAVSAATGDINITGLRNVNATGSDLTGVNLQALATVTKTGNGTLSIFGGGTAASSGSNSYGVLVNGSLVTLTATGPLNISGTGGGSGAASNNYGVYVYGNNTTLSASAGTQTLNGTGGSGSGGGHYGVYIDGANTANGAVVEASQVNGTLVISGLGGSGGNNNYGVAGANKGIVRSLNAAGAGSISIVGTGGSGGTGEHGIYWTGLGSNINSTGSSLTLSGIAGAGTGSSSGIQLVGDAQINQSGASNLTVKGDASAATGGGNNGVLATFNVQVNHAGASGALLVSGVGGAGTSSTGVYLQGTGVQVATGNASLTLSGTGGSGASNNVGIYIDGLSGGTGAVVNATGTGNVTLVGSAGGSDGHGIALFDKAIVRASGGSLNLTGSAVGASRVGIHTFGSANGIGSAGMTGDITLVADSMNLGSATVQTTGGGTLNLKPLTAARPIELGTGASDASALALDNTELLNLTAGGGIKVGDFFGAFSGNITSVGAGSVGAHSLSLWTKGGNIAINGDLTATGGFNIDTDRGSTMGGSITGTGILNAGTSNMVLIANNGISLSGANAFGTVNFANIETGNVSINAGGGTASTITSGANDAVGGSINFSKQAGNPLNISGAGITTKGGVVNLTSMGNNVNFQSSAGIDTTAGGNPAGANLTIIADDMQLPTTANKLRAGTNGFVSLQPWNNSRAIEIGNVNPTALSLSQPELGSITSGKELSVGGSGYTGGIVISDNISLTNVPLLYLRTGNVAGNAIDILGGSGITVATLAIDVIGGNVNLTGSNAVTNLSLRNTDTTGSFTRFSNTGALNLSAVSGLTAVNVTGATQTTTLSSTGAITQSAGSNVTANSLVTGSNGGTTLNNGANAISTFAATNTGSGGISLTNTAATLNLGAISQVATGAVTINNTGNIALNSTLNSNGSVTFNAIGSTADLTLNQGITYGGTGGAVTLNADNSVIISGGASDINTTNALNVVLNSNRDGIGTGSIALASGTAINTSGGNITLGGGGNPNTSAASGSGGSVGVNLAGATLNSAAGSISVRGIGGSNASGVHLDGANLTAAGGGNITLNGTAGAGGVWKAGVRFNNTSIADVQGSGTLTISGTGGTGASQLDDGIHFDNASQARANTGAIVMAGIGGNPGGGAGGDGVRLQGTTTGSSIQSYGGATISVTGTAGTTNGDAVGVDIYQGATITSNGGLVSISGTGGAGTINVYGVHLNAFGANGGITASGGAELRVTGTGGTGGTGLGGINVKLNQTIGGAAAGNILLKSNGGTGINLSGTIQSAGNVTLNAVGGGNVTQSAGSITAVGLRLIGNAASIFTLDSATNDVATLAGSLASGSNTGYRDASALAVGSVVSYDGTANTTATGLSVGNSNVSIHSTGNLSLTETLSAGTGAVRLQSAGSVTQTGAGVITAGSLGVNAGTAISLAATNNVAAGGSVAATAASGNLAFINASGVNFDVIGADGVLFAAQNGINASGYVVLSAGAGTFTQSATSNITAAGLEFNGAGAYALNNTGNAVPVVAATNGVGAISFVNGGSLSVGTVGATNGITRGGNVNLTAGGALTQTQAITANALTTNSTTGTILTSANAVSSFSAANSTSGAISLTNTGALSLGAISQTGSGAITINNAGNLTASAAAIGGAGATGNITFKADVIDLSSATSIQTNGGNVYFAPLTAATPVSIGGSAGFDISAVELGKVNTSVNRIFIGTDGTTTTAGTVTIASAGAVNVGGRDLTVSGADIVISTNQLSNAAKNVTLLTTSGDAAFAGNGSVSAGTVNITSAGGVTSGTATNDIISTAGSGTSINVTAQGASIGTSANPLVLSNGAGSSFLLQTINTGSNGAISIAQNSAVALDNNNAIITNGATSEAVNITSLGGGNAIVVIGSANLGTDIVSLKSAQDVTFSTGGVTVTAGALNLTAGGAVNFDNNSGTVTINAPVNTPVGTLTQFSNAGTRQFNGATASTFAGNVALSGGTNNFSGAGPSNFLGAVTLSGNATIGGTGNLNLSGSLSWLRGNMIGSGNVTLASGATASLDDASGGQTLDGKTFTIASGASATLNDVPLAVWALTVQNGGSLVNNGTLTINESYINGGAGVSSVVSTGTINANPGAGKVATFDSINLTQTGGAINVNSGTLSFSGSQNTTLTGAAVATINAGTVLAANAGANGSNLAQFNVGSAASMGGAGEFKVLGNSNDVTIDGTYGVTGKLTLNTGGGTAFLKFNQAGTVALGSFDHLAGELRGTSNVTVSGAYNWSGGVISGVDSAAAGFATSGTSTLTSGSLFMDNRTWQNSGTVNFTSGDIRANNGAVITNLAAGTFNLGSDYFDGALQSMGSISGSSAFNNSGTFNQTYSAGSSLNAVGGTMAFTNAAGATINVQGGTLRIDNLASNTNNGTINISGGKTFSTAGNPLVNSATTGFITTVGSTPATIVAGSTGLTNNGTIRVGGTGSPGQLNISGNFASGGTGVIDIDLSGSSVATGYDQINVTGTAALAGTMNVTEQGAFKGKFTDSFVPVVSTGARSGTFTAINTTASGAFYGAAYNANDVTLNLTAGTTNYTATGAQNWSTAANWDRGTPNANADAVYNLGGSNTLTISGTESAKTLVVTSSGTNIVSLTGGSLTLAQASSTDANSVLSISGGTLTGNGNLNVGGTFNWNGGAISGTGTLTTSASAVTTLDTLSLPILARAWDNFGTVNWTSAGNQFALNTASAVITNKVGGVFNAQTTSGSQMTGAGAFVNQGAFNKTVGTSADVNVTFSNTGSVAVTGGLLTISGSGTDTGAYTVGAGSTLRFGGGARVLNTGASVTGSGSGVFSGGTVDLNDTYSLGGTTTVSGAAVGFNGTYAGGGALTVSSGSASFDTPAVSVTLPGLTVNNGTLTGTDNLIVTGPVNWNGGAIAGTGTLTTNLGVVTTLDTLNFPVLGRAWDNFGTVNWTSGGNQFNLNTASAVITNKAGGVFDAQTTNGSQMNGSGSFLNQGAFNKSVGTLANINVPFSNTGSVAITGGALAIGASGGADTGTYNINFGTTLTFSGLHTFLGATINGLGAATFSAGTQTLTGAGLSATGGVTLNLAGATVSGGGALTTDAASTLAVSAGTLGNTGVVTANGAFNWSGGTISAPLTTSLGSITTLTGGTLQNGWTNFGTVNHSSSDLNLGGTSVINNSATGVWNESIVGNVFTNAANASFVNRGVFNLNSAGQADFNIGPGQPFNNIGAAIVNINGAAAVFNQNAWGQSGTINLNGGALKISGGSFTNSGTISGNGTINVSGGLGTFTNTGTLKPGGDGVVGAINVSGNLNLAGGSILNIDISGTTGGTFDKINVTGATTTLGDTLNLSELSGFSLGGGNSISFIGGTSTPGGTFATVNNPAGVVGAVNISGTGVHYDVGSVINNWIAGGGGDWGTAANWSRNHAPNGGESVTINPAGIQTITVPAGTYTVANVTVGDDALQINGAATIAVAGVGNGFVSGGSVLLSGGTLDLAGTGVHSIGGGLSGSGALIVSGGTLTAGTTFTLGIVNISNTGTLALGALNATVATFNQTGGTLTGTGNFTVTNNFVQSAGSFPTTFANININQAAGNLGVGFLQSAGTLTLSTPLGAITDGNGAGLNLSANSVVLSAGAGVIDLDVSAAALQVTHTTSDPVTLRGSSAAMTLAATTLNGPLTVSNTGNLTATGAVNAGADSVTLTSSTGAVTQTAAGNINAAALNVVAATGIDLTAASNTVNDFAATISTSGNVSLNNTAATLTINGISQPGGGVTINNLGHIHVGTAINYQTGLSIEALGTGSDLSTGASVLRQGTGAGFLTLTANRNIAIGGGQIRQAGSVLGDLADITLNANRANTGGAISIAGAGVLSNGGFIRMGGGATPATLPAVSTVGGVAGVEITGNSNINAFDGNVTIRGQGANNAGGNNYGVNIAATSVVKTNAGSVTLIGQGGNGGDNNVGVRIHNAPGTAVIAEGSGGTINITGTGGAGANYNNGVRIEGVGLAVRTVDGLINISGARGAGTGDFNFGLFVTGGGTPIDRTIETNGAGSINLWGGGAAAGVNNNAGIFFENSTINLSGTGTLSMVGVASGTGGNNVGVNLVNSVVNSANAAGTLSITGTGAAGANGVNISGITAINSAGALNVTSLAGGVLHQGTIASGGAASLIATAGNVNLTAGSTINTTGGNVLLNGAGGGAIGVLVNGVINTTGGNVDITGTGGSGAAAFVNGVVVGANIDTSAGGGAITIRGTGGTSSAAGAVRNGVVIQNAAEIKTGALALNITGTGGADSGGGTNGSANGIVMGQDAQLLSVGGGQINLTGTGTTATGTGASIGVVLGFSSDTTHGHIDSTAGAINITGLGAAGMGANLGTGVFLQHGSTINATGNSVINISGGTSGTVGASGSRGIAFNIGGVQNAIGGSNQTNTITLASSGGTAGAGLGLGKVLIRTLGNVLLDAQGGSAVGATSQNTGANAGTILASGLRVNSSGAGLIDLSSPGNLITTLAGNVGGDLTLVNSTGVSIGTVVTPGLGVSNNFNLTANGLIDQTAPLSVAGATVFDTSLATTRGNVSLFGGGLLALSAGSKIAGNLTASAGGTLDFGASVDVGGDALVTGTLSNTANLHAAGVNGALNTTGVVTASGGGPNYTLTGSDIANANGGNLTINLSRLGYTASNPQTGAAAINLPLGGNSFGPAGVSVNTVNPALSGPTPQNYNLIQGAGGFNFAGNNITINAGSALGDVTLTDLGNTNVGSFVLNGTRATNIKMQGSLAIGATTLASGGNLDVTGLGGINITGAINATGMNVVLTSTTGPVTQMLGNAIVADNLTVSAMSGINFDEPANDVRHVAFNNSTSGSMTMKNIGDLGVGFINGSGNVNLQTTGNLVVEQTLNNTGPASVTTLTGGTVSQLGSGAIQSANLIVESRGNTGAGAINLANSGNGVQSLSLRTMNAGGTLPVAGGITFRNATGFDIRGNGIATNGDATLMTDAGTVSQTTGAIGANTLSLIGPGAYTLNNASNTVGTLSANAGAISFNNSTNLSVNALTLNGDAILSSGNSSNINLSGASVTGTGALTVNTAGLTTLGGVNISGNLTTDAPGTSQIFGPVNASAVAINDPATLSGNVTSSIGQTYSTLTLANSVTLTNSGASNVSFNGPVNGTTAGAQNLTVQSSNASSSVVALVPIGTTTALGSLNVSAAGAIAIDAVTANGGINITGLNTATNGTLTTSNAAVSFGGAVLLNAPTNINAGTGSVSFNGTLDGGDALNIVAGPVNFTGGAVGGSQPIDGLNVTASGVITVQHPITSSAALNLTSTGLNLNGGSLDATTTVSLSGPVTLGAATTITGTGTSINGPVSGPHAFTVSGPVSLAGNVTTTGAAQSYGAVTLTGTTALTGSSLVYSSIAGGGNALTLSSAGGVALDGATVSGLGGLTVAAGTPTTLTGSLTTTGAQSYQSPVTLAGNTTLASGAGNVTFTGAIDATTAGAQALTINSAGATTFNGAVGGTNALASLTTDAPGTAVLAGGLLKATGAISIGELATITAPLNVSANGVTMAPGGTGALTIVSAGPVTFSGGNTGAAVNVTAAGAITQTGPMAAFGTLNLTSTGGAVTLGNTGNNFGNVSASAGGGNVTLNDSDGLTLVNIAASGGVLNVTSLGAVGQVGNLTMGTINVSGNGLLLNNAGNTFSNATLGGGTAQIGITTASALTVSGTTNAVGMSVNASGFTNAGTINAGGSAVALNARTGNLTTGGINGATTVLLLADALNVNGAINAGSTTVNAFSGSTPVTLGAGGSGLGLSNAEIGNIAGALTISGNNVTVDGNVTASNSTFTISASTLTVNNDLINSGGISLAASNIAINGATVQGSSATLNANAIALTGGAGGPAALVATTGNIAMTAPALSFVAGGGNGAFIEATLGSATLTSDGCTGCTTLSVSPTVSDVGLFAAGGITFVGFTPNAAALLDTSALINQTTSSTNNATTNTNNSNSGSNNGLALLNSGTGSGGNTGGLPSGGTGSTGDSADGFGSAVAGSSGTGGTGGSGGTGQGDGDTSGGQPKPQARPVIASCTAGA